MNHFNRDLSNYNSYLTKIKNQLSMLTYLGLLRNESAFLRLDRQQPAGLHLRLLLVLVSPQRRRLKVVQLLLLLVLTLNLWHDSTQVRSS